MSKLLSAAVCLSVVLLAGCSEGPEDAPKYLQKALEERSAGRNELAMVEVRNALKLDADLLEAMELQLELFEEDRKLGEIFALTETILGANPDHLAANLRRGELLLMNGDLAESATYIDRAVALAPDNIKGANLKTAHLIRSRDLEEARALSDRMLDTDLHNAASITLAGAIRLVEEDYAGAEQMVRRGLVAYPKDLPLHQLRIQLATEQSQFDKIPAIYQDLIGFHPEDLTLHRALATFFVRDGQPDQALRVMRDAVEQNPDNVDAKLLLGQLIAGTGDTGAAELIRELVVAAPTASELRFLLASVYRDSQQFNEAAEQYRTISESHEDDPIALEARAELARQALDQGRAEEARSLLDGIFEIDSAHPTALLISAYRYLLDGSPDQAIGALNTVLRNQPDDDRALFLMGRSYLLKELPDLARNSFVTALQANPDNALAAKHLAVIHLQKRQYAKVVDVLKSFEQLSDSDTALLGLLLQARIQLKQWPAANRLAAHPVLIDTHPGLKGWVKAMALQDAGDYSAAIVELQQVTTANPTRSGPARNLVNAHLRQKQSGQAIAYLHSVIGSHPALDWPGQLLVEVYVRVGQSKQAKAFLDEAIRRGHDKAYHYAYLAELELKDEGSDQALATAQTGVEAHPNSAPLKLTYAALLEQAGQTDAAAAHYEDVLRLDPSADIAANNLAVIYSRSEATLERAQQIAERFRDSSQPYFADTLGWICALRDDFSCALPLLENVVRQLPDQAEFNYHLGEAYRRARQNENARRYLHRAQDLVDQGNSFPDSDNIRAALDSVAG